MCLYVKCFLKYDTYVCVCMYTDTHIGSSGILSMLVTLYLTAVCLLDHLFQAWNSSRTKYPPCICQGLSVPLYWKPLLLLNAVHSCSGSYPLRPVFALHLILHSGRYPRPSLLQIPSTAALQAGGQALGESWHAWAWTSLWGCLLSAPHWEWGWCLWKIQSFTSWSVQFLRLCPSRALGAVARRRSTCIALILVCQSYVAALVWPLWFWDL